MEQGISKTEAMDLTLEELEKGIGTIKAFVEDMDKSRIGVIIKDKPDFGQFYNILDNLRNLVEQWKEDYLD